ncbi:MAG: site-specific integrase [Deltaproteobacteria bacterium]|nr:site-specific integrase [Deltaproteobacteria bacterium]
MRRSEIEDGWWTLPKERSKNGKAHRIPLSPLANELIRKASGDDYLFPSPRKNGPIGPDALTNAVTKNRHCFDTERFSTHDLRRTAATGMAQVGIPRFDIAKVLNHTDQEVTAIYDRWAYDAEKKKALLKWARRLQNILDEKVTDKVVKIS